MYRYKHRTRGYCRNENTSRCWASRSWQLLGALICARYFKYVDKTYSSYPTRNDLRALAEASESSKRGKAFLKTSTFLTSLGNRSSSLIACVIALKDDGKQRQRKMRVSRPDLAARNHVRSAILDVPASTVNNVTRNLTGSSARLMRRDIQSSEATIVTGESRNEVALISLSVPFSAVIDASGTRRMTGTRAIVIGRQRRGVKEGSKRENVNNQPPRVVLIYLNPARLLCCAWRLA
jgi:hypothetical protein